MCGLFPVQVSRDTPVIPHLVNPSCSFAVVAVIFFFVSHWFAYVKGARFISFYSFVCYV